MAEPIPIRPKRAKTGGRVKGTPNKATRLKRQAIVDALVAEVLTPDQIELLEPLDVLLRVMRLRLRAGDDAGALIAATAAAPFRHARLSSSDVRVSGGLDVKPQVEIMHEVLALIPLALAAATEAERLELLGTPELAALLEAPVKN